MTALHALMISFTNTSNRVVVTVHFLTIRSQQFSSVEHLPPLCALKGSFACLDDFVYQQTFELQFGKITVELLDCFQ